MITKKNRFPDIELKSSTSMMEGKITISARSYVRIKKKGTYYLLAVSDYHKLDLNTLNFLPEYNQFIQGFINRCNTAKYLWSLPNEETISKMILEETLAIDHIDLTDKELFLLNKQI